MSVLKEYNNTNDIVSAGMIGPDYWKGQQFTAESDYSGTSVKLYLNKPGGSSPGTLYVDIYAVDGSGHPTGASLASGTTDADTLPDNVDTWREVTFSSPVSIVDTTQYVIVTHCPGSSGNQLSWRCSGNQYAGGLLIQSSDGGSNWSDYSSYDALFEMWGESGVTEGTSAIMMSANF